MMQRIEAESSPTSTVDDSKTTGQSKAETIPPWVSKKTIVSQSGPAITPQCQRCASKEHWTYQCRAAVKFVVRESRTKLLQKRFTEDDSGKIKMTDIVSTASFDKSEKKKKKRKRHRSNSSSSEEEREKRKKRKLKKKKKKAKKEHRREKKKQKLNTLSPD